MSPVEVSENIEPDENLGRGGFSGSHAKRAGRSRIPHHVFLEKPGETKISVDRVSVAPLSAATAIAEKTAAARNANFYGWATVVAKQAGTNGRQVVSSPLPEQDNPYHADILLPVLPGSAEESREEQKRHAQELADYSRWREKS